jgi:hypothetical protein
MARTGGRETCRGPVWPQRPAGAAVQWAWDRGTQSCAPATGGCRSATVRWSCRRNQWGWWSSQKSHHDLHRRCYSCRCCRRHYPYCGFCCCTCSGCHQCRRFCHWAGETVAWPSGTQRWCRAPSGQPEVRYCPCESPPVVDRPEL